ncbi:MAG: hypothetical protein KJZ78_24955 [Bryobacteraceae bacterium]|nr:hypothetical protein [Bryobacteraceae bacterium]
MLSGVAPGGKKAIRALMEDLHNSLSRPLPLTGVTNMEKKEFKTLIRSLSDTELVELHQTASEAVESRRSKATMDVIRPGMTKDEELAVLGEIARALKP